MAIICMQPPEKSSPDLESVTIPGFFIAQNIPTEILRQWQSSKQKRGAAYSAAPRLISKGWQKWKASIVFLKVSPIY
jgi:hypothetical protein